MAGGFYTIVGVTDGSSAPAGAVGECLEAWSDDPGSPITITGSGQPYIYFNVISLNLPAGDWDVGGYATFDLRAANAAAQFLQANFATSTVSAPAEPNFFNSTSIAVQQNWEVGGGPVITLQINLTAPTTVYIVGMVGSPDPADHAKTGALAWGIIHARRMR